MTDEDGWQHPKTDTTFEEIASPPEWDPSKRYQMEDTFQDFLTEETPPRFSTATIENYYVRKSASEIQQDLEIGLQFALPDGTTAWYECIHDADHPDEGLTRLLDHPTSTPNP